MYKPVHAIGVRIWNQAVGAVALDPRLGYYAFEYDPAFIAQGVELSPLAMPLAKAREPFIFADLSEQTFKRLPAMLADALPDDFGNSLIDAWMARRGVHQDSVTPLDRLAFMGKRGVGALEFHPARGSGIGSRTTISLPKLLDAARAAMSGELGSSTLAWSSLNQLIQVGTSAGGTRAKAAIAWNPANGEIRAGQFDVEDGFEHWLLKFDGTGTGHESGGPEDPGRIEYAYHLMAKDAGVQMSPCRLYEENGRAHFMTRRFDRDGNRKYHLQSLCAMAHLDWRNSTHDYCQLFQTIERLGLDYAAREQAFGRMVFNVSAANCDDHTRNFSFILRQGMNWELAPAYDVTFARHSRGDRPGRHRMSVNGKFENIESADLLAVAGQFGIGSAARVIRQVHDAIGQWRRHALEAGVSHGEADRIAQYHHTMG